MKKFLLIISLLLLAACSQNDELSAPDKVGDLVRLEVFTGEDAIREINTLHGVHVATEKNLIARYGDDPNELLYISRFESDEAAKLAFDSMLQKIANAKNGIFQHLMPIKKYGQQVYMTIGMGYIHYLYISGSDVLWYQTKQNFAMELPTQLMAIYPVKLVAIENN